MTKVVAFQEMLMDLALPQGVRTKLFGFPVALPESPRMIRIGLQGGAYFQWFDASVNLALRVEVSLVRTTIMNHPVVVAPTPGTETSGTQASGVVRFTGLEDGAVIVAGSQIRRATFEGGNYAAQATIEASGGAAEVPVQATIAGRGGNCPAGTPFLWGAAQGAAVDPFTGGSDRAPGANQFIHRMGNTMLLAESSRGPTIMIEVFVTDIASRAALPGVPVPEGPWMLCGINGPSFGALLRWPWRITVEDLEIEP